MASRSAKHSFDVYFPSTDDKDAFLARLHRVRERLTPPGQKLLSYRKLMLRLLDAVETDDEATQATDRAAGITSMNRNGGKVYELLLYLHGFSMACNQASSLRMSPLTMDASLSPRGIPSVTW